jgi:RNA polymerase sigma-70 factor (ECF subfamily)
VARDTDEPPPDGRRCEDDGLNRRLTEVYEALHSLARRAVRVRAGQPLMDPTELVHECYLKLRRSALAGDISRTELLALAATAIRTLLVDHARQASRLKRGGGMNRISLHADQLVSQETVDLLALDSALERLAELDPRMARIVELRFFAGLTVDETAEALGVKVHTVDHEWAMARAWLHRELAS